MQLDITVSAFEIFRCLLRASLCFLTQIILFTTVYLWAEVLDADAFAAFSETGDIFDEAVAAKAKEFIYSSGNTDAPDELFRKFRGRDPDISFMLAKKGLVVS